MTAEHHPDHPGTNHTEVTDEQDLRELIGTPSPRTLDKERSVPHEPDRTWLAHSPFCLVATSDELGNHDVSPRGIRPVSPWSSTSARSRCPNAPATAAPAVSTPSCATRMWDCST